MFPLISVRRYPASETRFSGMSAFGGRDGTTEGRRARVVIQIVGHAMHRCYREHCRPTRRPKPLLRTSSHAFSFSGAMQKAKSAMNAFLSETDKPATAAIGFTIPARRGGVLGRGGDGPTDYKDLNQPHDKTEQTTRMLTSNAAHLAQRLAASHYSALPKKLIESQSSYHFCNEP